MTEAAHDAWWRARNREYLCRGHAYLAASDQYRARLAYYAHIQEELARLRVKGWRLRHSEHIGT